MKISVIIPTYNPDLGRLRRTLQGLRDQSLAEADREVLLVNNASTQFPAADFFSECAPAHFSIVTEPQPGLTAARRKGLSAVQGDYAVLVDDDNVLASNYLAEAVALMTAHPKVGAAGGKSQPEFTAPPPDWTQEFYPLLALRDLGELPLIVSSLRPADSARNAYPAGAPIGAGMVLRRAAWESWVKATEPHSLSDRRGTALTSSGDNDIVLQVMKNGWSVAYFPNLELSHLIPSGRLEPDYLARLNRGIQLSWMHVLTRHDANPWPPLSPSGAKLRQMRAWFTNRAWSSPAARIRWQGACGHFEGRIGR